ncbi:MAG: hypothetical protein HYV63_12795 [Candidatus Schekmanbacteria bacterium]|nr:hypothetical protein [Candidatus Schekmanbacteria bacterium]
MRKYWIDAPSRARVEYGYDLIEGLGLFPETAELAAAFAPANDRLLQALRRRDDADFALPSQRARLRVRDYEYDQAVRGLSRAVELADGGRRGAIHDLIFGSGYGQLVKAAGAAQVGRAERFQSWFAEIADGRVEKLREEWRPKLQAAVDGLRQAAAAQQAAADAAAQARVAEEAAAVEHDLAVEKVFGEIRARLPKDAARQAAIVPKPAGGSSRRSAPKAAPEDAAAPRP